MSKILEIYNSEWREALAGKAFYMIQKDNPKYLDKFEEKRDTLKFDILINDLSSINSEKNWNESMKLLAHRIAIQYLGERITGRNLFPGGFMTLIGHAGHHMIDMGFLASLATELDEGSTEKLFQQYLMIDMAFQKAINSGDAENGRKLADGWRVAQIALRDSYDNLLERVEEHA